MDDLAFAEEVVSRLSGLPELRTEEMFGGQAIYSKDIFFAIAYQNRLYFRVTPATKKDFESYGSSAFQPSARVRLTTYYEVPSPVAKDESQLMEWAKKAVGKLHE